MRASGSDTMSAVTIHGVPEGYDALLLARRRAEHMPAACCTPPATTPAWRGCTRRWPSSRPKVEVLRFPAWDCLPYDRVSPNPAIVSERIACLARLLEPSGRPRIVLSTVNALVQRVPPRSGVPRRQPDRADQRHHHARRRSPASWKRTATAEPTR